MVSAIVTAFISFASTNIDDIFVLMVFFSQVDAQMKKHHIIVGQYLGISTLLFISILGSIGLNLIPQQYTGLLGVIPILLGIKEWLKYRKDKKEAMHSASEAKPEFRSETVINPAGNRDLIDGQESNSVKLEEVIKESDSEIAHSIEKCIQEGNAGQGPNADLEKIQINWIEKIKSMLGKLIHPAIINVFLVTIANGADNIGVYVPLFTTLNTLELIMTIIVFFLMIALWCFAGEKLTTIPRIKQTIHKYKNVIVPVVFIAIGLFIIIESDLISMLLGGIQKFGNE